MHTESSETERPMLRPKFGNVVSLVKETDKVAVLRFAVDNMLGYFDKTERKTKYKVKYFDIKFFNDALRQFKIDKIKKGDRLDLLDYFEIWEERYDKNIGKVVEKCDLGIKKYIHHPKNEDSNTLVETVTQNIDLKKPIINSNTASDDKGDPSWMTE